MVSDWSQGVPLEDIEHKKSNRRDTNIYFLDSTQKSALVLAVCLHSHWISKNRHILCGEHVSFKAKR